MRFLAFLALALACAFPAAAQTSGPTFGSSLQQDLWQGPPIGCEATPPGGYCFLNPAAVVSATWPATAPPGGSGAWWQAPVGISTAGLLDAVTAAKPGDTLSLAPGVHPHLAFRNRVFSPPLTITSADPARPAEINGLDFLGSSGLRLVNLDIHETNPVSAQSPVLNVVGSNDVQVTASTIRGVRDPVTGLLMGKGAVVTGGSGFVLSGSEVRDLFKGVSIADTANPLILNNDLHNIRTSPIDGGGLLVSPKVLGNHIHDIVPDRTQGDHSDGIHFFTKSGSPVHGLTIQGNRLECPGDCSGTLGINLEGTPAPGGFDGVVIDGNTLAWNNNQGITTNYVAGSITNNTLSPTVGLDNPAHAPAMVLRNSTVIADGNTWKCGPSAKPFTANTCLSAGQISAMGAAKP